MIHIPTRELRSVLSGLAKVVSSKITVEALRCIRVNASPDGVTLTGTDLAMTATVYLPEADSEMTGSFLLPLEALRSMARRLPSHSLIHLEPGKIHGDLGPSRISESVNVPDASEFPADFVIRSKPEELPETFRQRFAEAMGCASTDSSRYILNGVAMDVTATSEGGHYLVATDGHHLFSANSFTLPVKETTVIPCHKLLTWRGLPDAWALATEKISDHQVVRIEAGNWTLTMRAIEGSYPNWKQVLVHDHQVKTRLSFPEGHSFGEILQALPGGDLKDKPFDIVVAGSSVSLKDALGGQPVPLLGTTAQGPDLTVRLNRDFLAKAFEFGLTEVGIVDAMSPLRFTREGRTLIVMPLRVATVRPSPTQPAPPEPQPERKTTMPETIEHPRGSAPAGRRPGAESSELPTPTQTPALEAAMEKAATFKASVRESLGALDELTVLLRQALRDQKSAEKEVQTVRQTLRSLQNIRI